MIAMTASSRSLKPDDASTAVAEPLIPGLPDEVAELCLLHLPFPYHSLARSVSPHWNRALSSPSFLKSKSAFPPSLTLPFLFVFAFHRATFQLRWQAFDPRSRRWFVLPPMPIPAEAAAICPPAFACAAVPERGEIYVLGGMRSETQAPLPTAVSYRAATNSWTVAAPMLTPRSFFAAGAIGGRVFAAGGGDGGISSAECYDPKADRWVSVAGMRAGMARYDSVVIGRRMLITEGWTWPFTFSPRSGVYDADKNTWEEMSVGMREGWTGTSAVVDGQLFLVSEFGDMRLKAYDCENDKWKPVEGEGLPEELKKPYAVSGAEGKIYVVGRGMYIGVGTIAEKAMTWRVEWEVVRGPRSFGELSPCSSHLLYV